MKTRPHPRTADATTERKALPVSLEDIIFSLTPPTRRDWVAPSTDNGGQAGLGFGIYGGGYEWTATFFSGSNTNSWEAFHFSAIYGEVAHKTLSSAYAVRCVGR